ncbi:hypothetical protein [Gordonia sp. NPDC003422]
MTEHTDLDSRDSINHYLTVAALVAEARQHDALAYITSLDATEQIDMWIAGCSITIAFADDCRQFHGVPVDLPAWFRTMVALADEDGDQ